MQEYLHPETADFIQQQLALLDPIRVIIAPGIQDPYANESPYSNLNWPKNVDIFYQGKLTPLELTPQIHLWGACNPPVRGYKLLDNFQPAKGINILLLHAQRIASNREIHSVNTLDIQKAGFHLALLGSEHVAEMSLSNKPLLIFPGSPEPLSPLEGKGLHQLAFVDVEGDKIRIEPLSVQQWHYHSIEVDLTNFESNSEVASHIDVAIETEINESSNSAISVTLGGKPSFDLDISSLRQLIQTSAYYRLDDHFGLSYDLEQLAQEQTVRGLLVQRFLQRILNAANESEKQHQLTALNFALQALDGKQVNLYETKTN